jgi:hypothetical protein
MTIRCPSTSKSPKHPKIVGTQNPSKEQREKEKRRKNKTKL